ncbi:DNA-binding domain-containing protein [Bordetella sp. FB-8]|uniref:HvfC/BufC N-terminal domain-containing protein n=1 Tax=Bordetella sp. FB-8 TaxID=1159870 RepID=UPI0003800531|nr:DNA-binding domain-containing protein [Bordetella sp. FB-8]
MKSERRASHDAAAFAAGLTNPRLAAPEDVAVARGQGVVARYNVYRNNVTVSLIDALAAIYPAVQRITGVDFFRAMARFHVRSTPPVSPLLFEYGRDFPSFIQAYQYARGMPWLADTARIERAWLDAYHAADASPLPAEAFADIDPGSFAQVRFVAHPASRIVRSRYPAVAIFAMNRTDGPVTPLHSSEAQDALVTRPDDEVIVSLLPPGGAAFLGALLEGEPLATAAEAAFMESGAFDLPANLAAMISTGVFTAIQL